MGDLPERLEAADAAIGGVSIHLIRTGCGIALAKAMVNLKAAAQDAAARIRSLEGENARLISDIDRARASLNTEAAARIDAEASLAKAEGERDEARGWVRWLVYQATDDRLTLEERVGIVAHFPAKEYPPHPAESERDEALATIERMRAALEGTRMDWRALKRTGSKVAEFNERLIDAALDPDNASQEIKGVDRG